MARRANKNSKEGLKRRLEQLLKQPENQVNGCNPTPRSGILRSGSSSVDSFFARRFGVE